MVNDIIDGIVIKLDSMFGDDSVIHTESIEQGFTEPCFYVTLLASNQTLFHNNRYYLQNFFDVQYFPSTAEKNSEAHGVATRLYNLEFITAGGSLKRGTKMSYKIIDEVLHFFVQYNFYAYLTKEEVEKMQSIKVKGGLYG
jgi:hypothetical protein